MPIGSFDGITCTPDTYDWYFGVASRRDTLDKGTGKKGDLVSAPGFFLDIDLAGPGHVATNLPTEAQAADLLDEASVPPPSILIHSGGGWHVYWLFHEPVPVDAEWQRVLKNLQRRLFRTWERKKFHLDDTAKVTQVLRVPGTTNWKQLDNPRPVTPFEDIDETSVLRHHASDFDFERGRPKKSSSEAGGGIHRNSSSPTPLAGQTAPPWRRRAVSEEDFLGRLEEMLLSGSKGQLFELVINGQRFAEQERDNTLQALTSSAAFAARKISAKYATLGRLVDFFTPCMHAYVDEDWSLEENLAWVEEKLTRALEDAEIQISAVEEQDARLWAWFERHTAESENIIFKKGDAAEISTWLAGIKPTKVFARGLIHEFDGDGWLSVTKERAYADIVDFMQERVVVKPGVDAKGDPHPPKSIMLEHAKISGIYAQLSARLDAPEFFDSAPHGYAFTNGFLIVEDKSIKLAPHAEDHRNIGKPFLTYVPDPEPMLGPWFEYMDGLEHTIDEQVFIHEFIGIALLGLAPTYKKCLAFLGDGDNGKSVFINFVASLFFPGRTSQISPHRWGSRFGANALANSLLNYVEEVPTARIEATDVFKKIIGGSRMSTDVKNGAEFSFVPRAAHLFAFNELPLEAADLSDGWWSRWLLIPFRRQFTAVDKNPHQLEKLAPLRDAVASYCIQQAEYVIQNRGYTISDQLLQRVAEWRFKSDPIALFISTKVETNFEHRTPTEEVYMAYQLWCRQTHQVKPVSQDSFRDALAKHFKVADASQTRWPIKVRAFSGISNAPSNGVYPPLQVVPPA